MLYLHCREKLHYYASQAGGNVLSQLHTSFSRLEDEKAKFPRYVQESLLNEKMEVAEWILKKDAVVFVCG